MLSLAKNVKQTGLGLNWDNGFTIIIIIIIIIFNIYFSLKVIKKIKPRQKKMNHRRRFLLRDQQATALARKIAPQTSLMQVCWWMFRMHVKTKNTKRAKWAPNRLLSLKRGQGQNRRLFNRGRMSCRFDHFEQFKFEQVFQRRVAVANYCWINKGNGGSFFASFEELPISKA